MAMVVLTMPRCIGVPVLMVKEILAVGITRLRMIFVTGIMITTVQTRLLICALINSSKSLFKLFCLAMTLLRPMLE